MRQFAPMLLDERPLDLSEPGWVYEIKWDGYRLMAEFGELQCRLYTRGGADATRWFPEISSSLGKLDVPPCVVDGEVCVLDDHGRSDFNRLHDRARRRRWYKGADPVTFCVFDMLVDGGKDITGLPLLKRKARLAKRLGKTIASTMVVGHFLPGQAEQVFREAVIPLGLEGLVGKRADSSYQPGVRSSDWVKVKRKGAIPPERFKR